jgi:hypothetical protein
MTFVTAITNLIAQLNGTFVIAIFTAILILGVIATFLQEHHQAWKYVLNTCYVGGFVVGASALINAVLG